MAFIFLYCRGGFENECAAEIQELAEAAGTPGYCKAKPSAGYVLFYPYDPLQAFDLHDRLDFRRLIFARQWFVGIELLNELDIHNRVTPIVDVLSAVPLSVHTTSYEHLDTNEGKALSALCRSIGRPLDSALTESGLLTPSDRPSWRFHVCFLSTVAAVVGVSRVNNSASWPMGIPRLRLPRSAPSRATLKLEEAFHTFLSGQEREVKLRSGMHAVDLGAAPGGWTWYLVKNHLYVTAVDNGNMEQSLMDTGLVRHLREDGFTFQPDKRVDWLVCDIADKPSRVAHLIARWLSNRWCRATIFNLKLPMKKRYQELQICFEIIDVALRERGVSYDLLGKQLYHDREEVTVYIELLD